MSDQKRLAAPTFLIPSQSLGRLSVAERAEDLIEAVVTSHRAWRGVSGAVGKLAGARENRGGSEGEMKGSEVWQNTPGQHKKALFCTQ